MENLSLLHKDKDLPKNLCLKIFSIASFLLVLVVAICHYLFFDPYKLPETDIANLFKQWMIEHNKNYSNDRETYNRYVNFKYNFEHIISWNSKKINKATLEINKFADLTQEEFGQLWGGYSPKHYEHLNYVYLNDPGLPNDFDWSSNNAITPVKDQRGCAASWVFALVGSIESLGYLELDSLVSFSEQQVIDCAFPDRVKCHPGDVIEGFQYIKQNGIMTESEYPYQGAGGQCRFSKEDVEFSINNINLVPPNNMEQLKFAVGTQPVVAGIQADQFVMQFYKSGIIGTECGHQINHAVLVTGFGFHSDTLTDYWKIKNSWGRDWGLDGYALIARSSNNACGILSSASYPSL